MAAPAKINPARIQDVAIDLLREEGLEGVSLRKLATRLGVEAPSLYRHIGGKRQLLAQLTLALFRRQIDQIGPCATWQEWLLAFGRTLWSTQTRIPDSARLVSNTAFETEELALMSSWAAAPLLAHGVAPALASQMHLSVQALLLGLSALAEGSSGTAVRAVIDADAVMEGSLQALVSGWESRLDAA